MILSLAPKHTGTLTIPALNVDGVLTPAGQLIVTEQAAVPAGTTDLVFVETEVDKKSIYVQSQLIFTLRIYQSINLDNSSISELKIDDSFIEQLSQTSNQRTIGGRPYLVHDIKYAIFPQKSGELKIPSLTFTGNQSSGRRSLFDQPTQGRRIRRQTDALTITVKPIPNQFSGNNWLPASELTISESWSTEPEKLNVGESTTRTLTIKGKGLLAAQLPPNLAPSLTGAKFYPDQPQLENEKNELGVSSQRIDSSAIIMTQAGDYTLPETRIPWWDTNTNTQRWLTLPAKQFSVAASSEQRTNTQSPVQITDLTSNTVATEQNSPQAITVERLNPWWWWAITLITALGWLITTVLLVQQKRSAAATPQPKQTQLNQGEKTLFNAVQKNCADSDGSSQHADQRQAIIAWARCYFEQPELSTVQELCATLDDEALSKQLKVLDAALYSTETGKWDSQGFFEALKQYRKTHQQGGKKQQNALPGLYQ